MSRIRAKAHLIVPALALTGDEHRFEELVAEVHAGRSLFLDADRACLVVEVVRDDEGFSFNIWIAGGDLSEGLGLMPGLEALARGLGAAFVSFRGGRRGWGRLMAPHGYVWTGEEFRKAL